MASQYGEIPGPVNQIYQQKVKCIIIAVFCINTSEEYAHFGRGRHIAPECSGL